MYKLYFYPLNKIWGSCNFYLNINDSVDEMHLLEHSQDFVILS